VIDLPPFNYEQTIEAVTSCGVPAARIRIVYDADLQLDTVTIAPLDETPSQELLRCVYEATVTVGYDVQFRDPDQNAAFWELVLEEGRERARAEGQRWLQERGLFDNMPRYDSDRSTVAEFARQVEAFCGLEPGSALSEIGEGLLAPRVEFARSLSEDRSGSLGEKFICLMNVLAASDLGEGGVRFGFVGNSAPSDESNRR
jgi:hypothetical protein